MSDVLKSPLSVEKLAEAFRDLESQVCDVRNAMTVAEMVFSRTLWSHDVLIEPRIKEVLPGLAKYRIIILDEEWQGALSYICLQLCDVARALHEAWNEGFDEAGKAAKPEVPQTTASDDARPPTA